MVFRQAVISNWKTAAYERDSFMEKENNPLPRIV